MDTGRRGLVMSSRLRRQRQPTGAEQPEGMMAVRKGDLGNGPAEGWSLFSHSPGPERRVIGLEELDRLQREAGDDGLAGEWAS